MENLKKQLIFTAAVLCCALVVFALYLLPSDGSENIKTVHDSGMLYAVPSALPGENESPHSAFSQTKRLRLYGGLPFTLSKIHFMSFYKVALILIFISLFIKPYDPQTEFVLDSDGKK